MSLFSAPSIRSQSARNAAPQPPRHAVVHEPSFLERLRRIGRPTRRLASPTRGRAKEQTPLDTLAGRFTRAIDRIASAPDSAKNALLSILPELQWYTREHGGVFYTVVDGETSEQDDAELYRAIASLVALNSLLSNNHLSVVSLRSAAAALSPEAHAKARDIMVKACDLIERDSDAKDAMFYAVAVFNIGGSKNFRKRVNEFLDDDEKTDNPLLIMGHALKHGLDVNSKGYEVVAEALPTFKSLSSAMKIQLAAAFSTGFRLTQTLAGRATKFDPAYWHPRVLAGEAPVCEVKALLDGKRAGLTRQGLSMYLYAHVFHTVGAAGSETSIAPRIVPAWYAKWPEFINVLAKHMYDAEDAETEESADEALKMYHTLLRDAARETSVKKNTKDEDEMTDEDFVFLRIDALSGHQFVDASIMRNTLDDEEFKELVSEMAGKAAKPEIDIAHYPELIRRALYADTQLRARLDRNVEIEGYGDALRGLVSVYAAARAAAGEENTHATFQLNARALLSALRARAASRQSYESDVKSWVGDVPPPYAGGKAVHDVIASHTLEVHANEYKTEGVLALQSKSD